ncbi:MAG: phage tail protein [Jatrophihabitantaceae bacterium]
MTDPFLAEIRTFAGNFAPTGWALCNGQLMSISQNTALFSLLGTTYGGDGRVTFGLPNLQGSAPIQQGQGPGLTPRYLGEIGGSPTVTLITSEMPQHTHTAWAVDDSGDNTSPTNNTWAQALKGRVGDPLYSAGVQPNLTMNQQTVLPTGGGQPHNNLQPYLCVTFIIALQGIFPQRP